MDIPHRLPADEPPMADAGGMVLREVTVADLDVFFHHQCDPQAVRMAAFTAKDPSDRGAFDSHWRKILADPAVTVRTILFQGNVAGHVAAFGQPGEREVTYWVGREHWGKGVATEALRVFIADLPDRVLYARAARDNAASLKVLDKCGFTVTGSCRSFAQGRSAEEEEIILRLERPVGTHGATRPTRASFLRRLTVLSLLLFATAVAVWVPWKGKDWYAGVLFVLVTGASAVYRVVLEWRRQRKRKREINGLCPGCGYDLRASPDRCPECGVVVAPPPGTRLPEKAIQV